MRDAEPRTVGRKNWRVTLSRDRLTACLDYVPRDDLPQPAANEILTVAAEIGTPVEGLFDDEKLEKVLRNAETSGIALRQFPICDDLDGGFDIEISSDKTVATLSLKKGRGRGTALELKELGAALRSSGIKNLKYDAIKTDILTFYRGTELSLADYALAAGTSPEKGVDQELTWDVEFMPATELAERKKAAEDPPADAFVKIDSIEEYPIAIVQDSCFVKSDQVIATSTPLDKGKNGSDVLGASLEGIPGNEIGMELHENCAKRDEKIVSEIDGILERWDSDDVIHLRVRPHTDAQIVPQIAADAMTATVDLIQGVGTGTRLHSEEVRQALIALEVIRGIDLDAIEVSVRMAEENGSVEQAVVATGEQVEDPKTSSLSFLIELASGRGVTIKEDGRADYRNQDRFTSVEEGTRIAEIVTPETPMNDGFDVRGKKIEAQKVGELNLQIGNNIIQEKDDSGRLTLIAGSAGEIAYDGKSIDIVGVHTIKGDVGPATGNVRFAGPVNVTGSVLPGFAVIASGTVKIAESVEAALVSSEKSVHIGQGVKGGDKAAVRARENITAAFAEQVVLMSVQDITIKNACLRCSSKCNGRIKLESEKGYLVGGNTKSRGGVEAANIGSKNGAKTYISFGQDYLIGDKIDLEQKELEKLKNAAVKTDALIHKAEKDGDVPELKKQRAMKLRILKMNEKRTERLFWLREKFEHHYESEVVVRGTAYPAVTLESHGRTYEITTEKHKVVFFFNREKGIIENRPLSAEEN